MNAPDVSREVGIAEAVAEALVEHRTQRSGRTVALLAALAAQLSEDLAATEVELVLCRVALTSELVASDIASWIPARWVGSAQDRAVGWFLLVAKQAGSAEAEGLERWLLAIGPTLARLPSVSQLEQLDVLVQYVARLGSLRLDAAAVTDLVTARTTAPWGPDARVGVLTAAFELEQLLVGFDLTAVVDEADALLRGDQLQAMPRDRLSDARASRRGRLSADTPSSRGDEAIDRALTTYQALMNTGDYVGAALSVEALRDAPARVALIGANLRGMAQLHDRTLESQDEMAAELARLAAIARLPESIELERTAPLASPGAMLREIAAHCIAEGTSTGDRSAALALEIIADARVARVRSVANGSTVTDSLAAVATDRRSIGVPRLSLGDRGGTAGGDFIHVVELSLDDGAALIAVTSVDVVSDRSSSHVTALFGSDLRVVRRLLRDPPQAERLADNEAERLGRLIFGPLTDVHRPVVVPSPILWSLPFERLLPGTSLALSASSHVERRPEQPVVGQRLRVHFVGDPALPGAESERTTLRRLAAQDVLELVEGSSLRMLPEATSSSDVLALAVHGRGSGLTYELRLGSERLPAHDLIGTELPSTVVAASCSSGVRGGSLDLATILSGAAPTVVVGLWDIDDQVSGTHLGTFYEALAAGESAPAAWSRLPASARLSGLRLLAGRH